MLAFRLFPAVSLSMPVAAPLSSPNTAESTVEREAAGNESLLGGRDGCGGKVTHANNSRREDFVSRLSHTLSLPLQPRRAD